jgi:hypothetical protein
MQKRIKSLKSKILVNSKIVETHVGNWDEIVIEHPLINFMTVVMFFDDFSKKKKVKKCVIAPNNLIRIVFNKKDYDDIPLHVNDEEGKVYFEVNDDNKKNAYLIKKIILKKLQAVIKKIEYNDDAKKNMFKRIKKMKFQVE